MLLTTSCMVCGTGCVRAVGRAPGGQTRSLGKQVYALKKVALEMKFYEGSYNFHKWNFRGFLICNSWVPAELFLKKQLVTNFSTI